MRYRTLSEKSRLVSASSANRAYTSITLCLHGLLWSSLCIIGCTSYVIAVREIDHDTLPAATVALSTATASIVYVCLHNATAYLSAANRAMSKRRLRHGFLRSATMVLRLSVTAWLVSSGLGVIFTIVRYPRCFPTTDDGLSHGSTGLPCVFQHSSFALSLFALTIAMILFVLMQKTQDPFRCHLFGKVEEQHLLSLMLPYSKLQRPMFSEMSFKCRSSNSTSSNTLVPSFSESTTKLLPDRPEKIVGLGIYAPTTSATFLAPRPSLTSIRSHATMRSRPPTSPLPPLPAYLPERYRRGSALHKAVYPPRRPSTPERSQSQRTVRIVPPSPSLSVANLEAHNMSVESLSSTYSRSTSGEKHSPRPLHAAGGFSQGSRSYSSGSTATVKKSPLGAMRLAEKPDVVFIGASRASSASSESDINDAAMLQAKLPSVKAVSEFGDVQTWVVKDAKPTTRNLLSVQLQQDRPLKSGGIMPLAVRKTRNSAFLIRSHVVTAV